MRGKLTNLLLGCVLCVGLMGSLVGAVNAQAPVPTLTPTLAPTLQQPAVQPADPDFVSLDMIGQGEIQLIGPLDSNSFSFALPADWQLKAGAQLDLLIAVSFNSTVQSQLALGTPSVNNTFVTGGGTLAVYFNNTLLGVISLNQAGEIERALPIPSAALVPVRTDGRMLVNFVLDSRFACYLNNQLSLTIHATSHFILPHDSVVPSTSLANFPQPIYQGSFIPDSALLIIPDQPSAMDLRDALTVAAGLGNLSGNALSLDMTTVGQLTSDQESANHLIFIGKASSLPDLQKFKLPVPVTDGQFQVVGGNPDDGLIQMINSPWSAAHVILVISGNTDQAVLKAAQAIGTGSLLPNRFPNVAVVQQVQTTPVSSPQPVDQTLADLGYPTGRLFNHFGVDTAPYRFYIPAGWTVASDANFQLVFGNSQLLNYDRSGIVVLLNNIPIGSVRMSDTTAALANNKVQISIPSSAVVTGYNELAVKVNLVPLADCTPPNLQSLWVQIWPESTLHLPLNPTPLNPVSNLSLANYPEPFVYDPVLGNTAFVLPQNNLTVWREAMQIAAYLGWSTNGPLFDLSVFYGDQVPAAERTTHNLIVIGQPNQMPIVNELNNSLPVPFSDGSNVPAAGNFQVTYRISPDSPMGYIEMMTSPWNTKNIVLAVLGNTAQGVSWATSALIDSRLRPQLAGNFDVINDTQIVTTDTRLSSVVANATPNAPTQAPSVIAVSPAVQPSTSAARPGWILPALVVLVVLIVVVVAVASFGRWSRRRIKN